jgi:hypothetical protein
VGQLIKLQDYISRYELDIYRYPSEFIRLKKTQWEKVKYAWENEMLDAFYPSEQRAQESWEWMEEKKSFFSTLKNWFRRSSAQEEERITEEVKQSSNVEDPFSFSITTEPKTLEDLKTLFLEKVFHLQLRWASSTLRDESIIDKKYYYDEDLKYFLQRFPDTYLCLYKPVFRLKNAPVELEIILLSPIMTWCITLAEGEEDNIVIGSHERFWTELTNGQEKKRLNPLIALNRMEKIVHAIYQLHDIEFPIKKVILNRRGYIDYRHAPQDIELIDKRRYEEWFSTLRSLTSPLKHVQLKAASSLLNYCHSQYCERLEWQEIDESEEKEANP